MNEIENNEYFLQEHRLPQAYLETARRYFDPLVRALIALFREQQSKALLVSLSGCQGSGKSTLADYLRYSLIKLGINTINVSLDDFYLSKRERENRAQSIHPLFRTRGVPGTHNTQRLINTLRCAKHGKLSGEALPRFDKLCDDLMPESEWITVDESPSVFILEGWCLGAEAVDESELLAPCNTFEETKDPDGQWRSAVNRFLRADYHLINSLFDVQLFLKAPGFESVFEWRLEQEEKLQKRLADEKGGTAIEASKPSGMSKEQVREFIQYYQRITEHLLATLPSKADVVWELDDHRQVVAISVSEQLKRYVPKNNNEMDRKVD